MRAQRAPLRPTFSPARLCHVVYAGFSGGQMETILAWDSTSHGGKMPEGYLHLTCEQRCQIYALLQSGHSQAHIARKIGVDPSTISRELVRNTGARGYRFKQAHEKASQRREEASDKPRKMTPDLVELIEEKLTQEQWSPDQISGRLAKDGVAFISHERIYQHVWKDKKDGGTLYLHLRHSGKKYNKRKGKNSGRGLIPTASTSISDLPLSPQKAASETGRPTRLSVPITEALSCRMSSETPNTPSSPSCRTRARTLSCRPARACFCRSLTASKQSLTTMEKSSPLTSKSQLRWGRYPILPNHITRGNAASTNTPTASSDSTSQKVQTSLFCPIPMSKGSRINLTLAPERYSATRPLARFSSTPKICSLHFTIEWANLFFSAFGFFFSRLLLRCPLAMSSSPAACGTEFGLELAAFQQSIYVLLSLGLLTAILGDELGSEIILVLERRQVLLGELAPCGFDLLENDLSSLGFCCGSLICHLSVSKIGMNYLLSGCI